MGGGGQKWMWPFRSLDYKVCCISGTKWWNEVILCMLGTNIGKLKVFLLDGHGQSQVGLINQGNLKSSVSPKWFDELSKLIDFCWQWWQMFWFDGQSTLYLWHLNPGGPLQLYLAWFFLEKMPFREKEHHMLKNDFLGFFYCFEKFCYWF